ncbi:MAG: 2Fe-2S iron-sulfur cluster-binding protein, partial [Alphaproteobacteria bacterium]|nr:2Fe-2S iron-sulfur cluster-binding protein [Alphaproteobacteria bacterium]
MKIEIVLHRDGEDRPVSFDYRPREEGERPMVLDVLLQAQAGDIPDLSFRYGCRNRACGMCTVDVNGRPRLSCR